MNQNLNLCLSIVVVPTLTMASIFLLDRVQYGLQDNPLTGTAFYDMQRSGKYNQGRDTLYDVIVKQHVMLKHSQVLNSLNPK